MLNTWNRQPPVSVSTEAKCVICIMEEANRLELAIKKRREAALGKYKIN